MKKSLIVIGMIAACAGCARVQDGTLTKCKHCDKVMTNTVQTLTVPIWQARNHYQASPVRPPRHPRGGLGHAGVRAAAVRVTDG